MEKLEVQSASSTIEQSDDEKAESDAGFDDLDLPEVLKVSLQKSDTEKSFIWYSSATSEQERLMIPHLLEVQDSAALPKYLGALVSAASNAHEFLVNRISAKLQAWKGRTLSLTGRLILIKSTLQSLTVYYMSTTKILTQIIKGITDLMRRAFLGKQIKSAFWHMSCGIKSQSLCKMGGWGLEI